MAASMFVVSSLRRHSWIISSRTDDADSWPRFNFSASRKFTDSGESVNLFVALWLAVSFDDLRDRFGILIMMPLLFDFSN